MTEKLVYADIYYQVEYAWKEGDGFCGLNFVAKQIRTLTMDDEVDELDEGEVLNGFIRFDGCMNVLLQEGYSHFCGRKQTTQYAELFNRIYDKALEVGCSDD